MEEVITNDFTVSHKWKTDIFKVDFVHLQWLLSYVDPRRTLK